MLAVVMLIAIADGGRVQPAGVRKLRERRDPVKGKIPERPIVSERGVGMLMRV